MTYDGNLLQKTANELGYYEFDYRLEEDPDLTYQEYVILVMLRSGAYNDHAIDFEQTIKDTILLLGKNIYAEWYKENCCGSKTHKVEIKRPWDKVLVNKRKAK